MVLKNPFLHIPTKFKGVDPAIDRPSDNKLLVSLSLCYVQSFCPKCPVELLIDIFYLKKTAL